MGNTSRPIAFGFPKSEANTKDEETSLNEMIDPNRSRQKQACRGLLKRRNYASYKSDFYNSMKAKTICERHVLDRMEVT